MQVVAIEGNLTDCEVKALLQSPIYTCVPDFAPSNEEKKRNESARRGLDMDFFRGELLDLAAKTRPDPKKPDVPPSMTEEQYLKRTSQIIYHNNAFIKDYHRVERALETYKQIEPLIWMKTKVLSYCDTHPVQQQTQEDIEKFFASIGPFLRNHGIILSKNEILNLINIRPNDETCLMLVISSLLDRIPSPTLRQELLDIVAILPDPPEVVFDEDIANDITDEVLPSPDAPRVQHTTHKSSSTINEKGKNDSDNDDYSDDDDELDQSLELLHRQMHDEMDSFVNDAFAQFDRDDDFGGDDD